MKARARAIAPALMLTLLAACGSHDDQARWNAEAAVKQRLKDPDSAKFSGVFLVRQPAQSDISHVHICGVVDGKNSFGAMTGGTRFVVVALQGQNLFDISNLQIEGPDRSATVDSRSGGQPTTVFEKVYWNAYCVDATHPPTFTGER
ncbi:MAG: hypothetical protein IAE86_06915 [Burkholderiaceae bacterium]|nr:hypothetical protein [Burkholderiaceae bacterium]